MVLIRQSGNSWSAAQIESRWEPDRYTVTRRELSGDWAAAWRQLQEIGLLGMPLSPPRSGEMDAGGRLGGDAGAPPRQ